jgi:NADPH-dependent 2,4-dienoyl-CoA reductase/sulfur reductase-like enzyme
MERPGAAVTGGLAENDVGNLAPPQDANYLCVLQFVVPATEFLKDSGVTLDGDGFIQADEMLRTSAAGVFAAGDAVDFYDPVFGRRRSVEHWDNAVRQGRLAARNMLGRRQRYDEVSWHF